jgi:hypothetical protein
MGSHFTIVWEAMRRRQYNSNTVDAGANAAAGNLAGLLNDNLN